MSGKKIARLGDKARAHTDILGNEIIGVVTESSENVICEDIGVARNGDNVFFYSHPHALCPEPCDFREHNVGIISERDVIVNDQPISLYGDIVPVEDVAGSDAWIEATTNKTLGE